MQVGGGPLCYRDAAVFFGRRSADGVFGTGPVDQAHTADEWLDLDQLDTAAEIFYDLARLRLNDLA